MTQNQDTYSGTFDYSRGNGPGRLTISTNSPISDLGDWVLENHDGITAVGVMRDLTRVVNEYLHYAVKQARDEGASWATIGDELEVTRQAAQERFGRKEAHQRLGTEIHIAAEALANHVAPR